MITQTTCITQSRINHLVQWKVAIEAAILHQTKHTNLVLLLPILGILHDVPRLKKRKEVDKHIHM